MDITINVNKQTNNKTGKCRKLHKPSELKKFNTLTTSQLSFFHLLALKTNHLKHLQGKHENLSWSAQTSIIIDQREMGIS